MRAMHQQLTIALEGLTRQNTEMQNELNQSRQQAANEFAAPRQEVRGAPLRGMQATEVGVETRLLVKPSGFSGAQDAWRDWSTVFKGSAGAAIPRLQKLMDDAAKAAATIPNATIMDENDRAASTQLYWMMLTICKGVALNTVFLAGDIEGLEAWRQLTEKFEPNTVCRAINVHLFLADGSVRWQRTNATVARLMMMKSRLEQCCSDCPNHS